MLDFRQSFINSTMRKVLKRMNYPLEVMLTCMRWYVEHPLSLRHIEEMIQEGSENHLAGILPSTTVKRTG